jgi:DNA-binding transcriptional LysR family regulator
MRQVLDREFRDAGLKPAAVAAQTPSILATIAMLRDTDLLAVMPDTVARDFEAQGKLVGVPVRLRHALEPYGIVTRKGRALPAPARHFIDAVREAAR